MSPYCSAHDEWLIMKLCMYVGYQDANNVSNFGGDPLTQLNLKNVLQYYLRCFTDMTLHSRYVVTVSAALLRDHAQTAAVWKTVEEIRGHTSLSTALVMPTLVEPQNDTHSLCATRPTVWSQRTNIMYVSNERNTKLNVRKYKNYHILCLATIPFFMK